MPARPAASGFAVPPGERSLREVQRARLAILAAACQAAPEQCLVVRWQAQMEPQAWAAVPPRWICSRTATRSKRKADKADAGVSLKFPRVERQMALAKASNSGCRKGTGWCRRRSPLGRGTLMCGVRKALGASGAARSDVADMRQAASSQRPLKA